VVRDVRIREISNTFNLFLTKDAEAADWDGFAASQGQAEKHRQAIRPRPGVPKSNGPALMVMTEMGPVYERLKADGKGRDLDGHPGNGPGADRTRFTQIEYRVIGIDASPSRDRHGAITKIVGREYGSMG